MKVRLLTVFFLLFASVAYAVTPSVVTYQPSDTGGGIATSITCVAPTGISTDDLLVIIAGDDADNSTAAEFDAETGWTKLGESGDADSDAHIAVYYLVSVAGAEGNITIDHTSNADELWCMYLRIDNHDLTTPIDQNTFSQNTNASPQTASAVSASANNSLIITGFAWDGGDTEPYTIGGTGWAQVGSDISSGTASGDAGGAVGERDQATLGAGVDSTCSADPADGAAYFQFSIYEEGGPSAPDLPTITITTPTADPTWATYTEPLSTGGTASSGRTIESVVWSISESSTSGTADGTSTWTDTIALVEGTNTIYYVVEDAGANTASDTLDVTYTLPITHFTGANL